MKNIFLLLIFLYGFYANGQPVFMDKSGRVSFYSEAPLENIEAVNKGMNSILNTSTNEVAFIVPIRGFKFAKELMQEHFNEKYLESDKYPQATFKCTLLDTVNWAVAGNYTVSCKGIFTLHGIEKEITEKGTFTVDGKHIHLESEFQIAIAEYGITIPKLLFQNIADTVLVKLQSNFEPFKKQ